MRDLRSQKESPRIGPGRVPHVLFGVALALLALVAVWWFVFLAREVHLEDHLREENLDLRAKALMATHATRTPGPLPEDPRFEVVTSPDGLVARPTHATLTAEHDRVRRRRSMIYGEGSFLLLLVLVCVFMLYRLVLAEQRYRRDIDAFMGRVTHEMKTPLAGLKALLQTLEQGRVPEERLREIAQLGLRQCEREEHLIENLLTAHRLKTPGGMLPLGEVDLAPVLAAFVEHRRRSMPGGGESLELSCPGSLPSVGNAGAVQTILENLADNAFKYGARSLRLLASGDARHATLQVHDDGEGFEPSRAEDLFLPFHRDSSVRVAGRHGTGLGLPIARSLAREMGGDLVATSEGCGCGARFTLTLPTPANMSASPAPRGAAPRRSAT